MTDWHTQTLTGVRDLLARRDIGAREAVQASLDRIQATEDRISSLLHVDAEQALNRARKLDELGPGQNQPLWGVPLVVKDVFTTKGTPSTCGSKMLQSFVPFYDAEVIRRLKEAGAVIVAKSNMDEFAMGSSTENSAFQMTRNPWDLSRVPGGSSGGSAASTAAGQTPASLGTDTGGSIRQPAGFCGLAGLKPTYGRVSRFGLVAYGSSLDQAGPMARTVRDVAQVLEVIAGHDPKDSTSAPVQVPAYTRALDHREDLRGLRVGVPAEYWGEGIDPEVMEACEQALDRIRDLGAQTVPISLPHTKFAIAAYYIIVMAEASSNLARYDGVRYGLRDSAAKELKDMYTGSRSQGFGPEVQRRILLGTYVLSAGYYDAYYKKAAQVRRLITEEYEQALTECDLLCAPIAPTAAFALGEKSSDPLQMYLTDVFTNPLNLTGLPGLCLPVGQGSRTKMPIGLQLFGRAFEEQTILQAGHVLEQALPPLPQPSALADLT
ncbi:Asp-tRNA(Asn)/Glu-tRNA(Gln) amidotransferase subunit GatA [Desulfovermiculus halophilus]|jgi:aspartyl-tRNA(Asn)/glutamyl-tRNA(Gln) amidotransferase subunit A|uniref:Asp-tRNA(Asn)/Glu-tRNA(Gln) amidotransferase subunit GatA n=1 Tax=Desulfovermiculus halophilus TaxID=339722 RepID=UPI0004839AAB|nr:Asp-tRNA(Asn)/Glu-tRNA(Gln) amidotransferase subunit GatA [Desulfovermiculus halophilus]